MDKKAKADANTEYIQINSKEILILTHRHGEEPVRTIAECFPPKEASGKKIGVVNE
jgi:hypothetical protein